MIAVGSLMLRVIYSKCFFLNTTVFIVLVSKSKKINENKLSLSFLKRELGVRGGNLLRLSLLGVTN